MGTYDRQIASAKRMLKKYGQSITWTSLTDGDPSDSSQPWKVTDADPSDNTAIIAFFEIGSETRKMQMYRAGTEISQGVLMGYMAAQGFTPKIKDVITRDGEQYTVKNIDTLSPNGEVILYTIEFEL